MAAQAACPRPGAQGASTACRQQARAARATSPGARPARQPGVKRRGGAARRLAALALAYGQRAVRMGYDRALFGMRLAACRTLSQARPRVRRRAPGGPLSWGSAPCACRGRRRGCLPGEV